MKRIIKETTEKEIEVILPCFIGLGENHFVKIVDEQNIIIVNTYNFNTSIELGKIDHCNPFGNEDWRFITESEFDAAYLLAYEKISQFIPITN